MQIEHIDIAGFRGIQRLSIQFNALTTLIGENTWGKSSLLDALALALPTHGNLYHFVEKDFHIDQENAKPQSQQLHIIIRWKANRKRDYRAGRYRRLTPLWVKNDLGQKRIIYQLSAHRHTNKIVTLHQFLDFNGRPLPYANSERLIRDFITLHPVIRLRDARHVVHNPAMLGTTRHEKRMHNTLRRLTTMPGHVSKAELKSSLKTMEQLIAHYFTFQPMQTVQIRNWDQLIERVRPAEDMLAYAQKEHSKSRRILLMGLLHYYLQAKGAYNLRQRSRPILIIEDPESRLHPTLLMQAWRLFALFPMQKILTTNSGELVSTVPLSSLRRLSRQPHQTIAYQLRPQQLNQDELRRISFHIRFHRSHALFARCWLLVEGETEVWIFNEMAKLLGYQLTAEGIHLIEFAQSGLRPIIKVAQALGIDWHVCTDGDSAGKKYAAAAKQLVRDHSPQKHVTQLPAQDMEDFFYHHGFEHFFRRLINLSTDHPIAAKKVIKRVLKKYAKPDLALALILQCQKGGPEQIPSLIHHILRRCINMARANN